ncbi:outer membrane lipid asymmetry maintenance protein MlaD [Opitutales bacterium ASA1]|jgi:phospholipid/cholesterol/gamma-HCH transport system substrate-binding protein|uniref:outer membrane lipid asymmetry maintenance protein MlaD n=1 Tax=Congregicoccus parvus TaxID=3081749 RepID=UPI002B2F7B94|nr:outer membrane lipid asymmetry maintenance protein MlaD [Opitutales bacterium ASA1]
MKISRIETAVGAFVLVGIVAVAYLALKIGGGTFGGSDTYPVFARFSNAAGVNPGANVSISGVVVGRVEAVRLDPETFAAVVEMRLRNDLKLASDSIVSVKTSGLIGDKFLAILPGVEDELVEARGTFTETESTVDLESLISRFAFGSVDNQKEEAK